MKRLGVLIVCLALILTSLPIAPIVASGEEDTNDNIKIDTSGYTVIAGIEDYEVDGSKVTLKLKDGNKTQISFLSHNMFRYYVDINDSEFLEYPNPRSRSHEATIVERPDSDWFDEVGVKPVVEDGDVLRISTDKITLLIDKKTSQLTVKNKSGKVVLEEVAPIMYKPGQTIQSLSEGSDEYFFGGGMQNGRFTHKGESIKIENTNNWVDGGVASPNPFYWSTKGYGVVRNTFQPGEYDFGNTNDGIVQTRHNENRFDAYIFVADDPVGILNEYTNLTGKPAHLPDYAFYLSHLNCYNRDAWKEVPKGTSGAKHIDGKYYVETNRGGSTNEGEMLESLMPKEENNPKPGEDNYPVTAKKIIDLHEKHDMPFGWILPNDGYGCGYGQTDSLEGDIKELKQFTDYANSKGVQVGLWTQSNLWPKDEDNPQKGERDIKREVQGAGVRAIKTDVAWVGPGYSMALDGVMRGYNAITELGNSKPAIVSLDGWAGTQRYAGIWSGDQSGGNWEYIRFHIPTYIGTGLSGMPYLGSDMDGIFSGGNPVIQTRDFQWKTFTPYMLDMDGWGSSQKNPWEFGEDNTSINRAYLKLKAHMMPYIATVSKRSATTGEPMVRPMFFEEENAYTYSKATQYQFMWGDDFLVAPIYKNTNMDKDGNDIRDEIYLPGTTDIWVDYLTGEQYRGGVILNEFDAPIWKTPVFVKNGAIIPLYANHNNPSPITEDNPMGLDKSIRRVEVFPYGNTSFELYEDDGITFKGSGFTALYESKVEEDTAVLKINKAKGGYDGVIRNRSTEAIFNVSEAPEKVTGKVAGKDVEFKKVDTLEEYENAEGNVYFYNEAPLNIVSQYATKGSTYDNEPITRRPQLYVKSTDKIDIFQHDFEIVVKGFKNEADLGKNEIIEDLEVPTGLRADEVTDSMVKIVWDQVEDAETYDVETDGVIYTNIKSTEFTHSGLKYSTEYTYRVRSVTAEGYSNWSEPLTVETDQDPYRNVPKDMEATWTGGSAYSGKPEDAIDLDFASQFHSQSNALSSYFIIDMKEVYELEKFEYVPRQDNFGNGTLQQFDLEYSIDGVNWKTAYSVGPDGDEPEWTWPSRAQDEIVSKTIDIEINARYLRIVTKKSRGNFFTAVEVIPYAKEEAPSYPAGDYNKDGAVDEKDLTFLENYAGLRTVDSDFIGYADMADVNFDGVIDAYDIHFTTRQLFGGVSELDKPVKGKMIVQADKDAAKKGDTVTYTVYGLDMEYVNAFGIEFELDSEVHDVNNIKNNLTPVSEHMHSFSKHRMHTDGTHNNYIIASNLGENIRLEGTAPIAKFKVVYRQDTDNTNIEVVKADFVGSNLSIVDAAYTGEPTTPPTEKALRKDDIKSLTFTNEHLPEDDGSNGSKLFQQSNYFDLLFDGDKSGNLAEFKWYFNPDSFGPEVTLPTTFHIELKNQENVKEINVYNRIPANNGTVTSIEAKAFSGDKEYDLGSIDEEQAIFTFTLPEDAERIDKIEITPKTSRGTTDFPDGNNSNRMLSLYEIEIMVEIGESVSEIKFNMDKEVNLGSITKIDVDVLPEGAINKLYEVTSDNPEIASVIKTRTETSYDYYLVAHKPGKVILTATSLENKDVTAKLEVEILDSLDVSELRELVTEVEKLYEHLYTEESLLKVLDLVEEAEKILEDPTSIDEIIRITYNLKRAIGNLEFKGSDESREDSKNLIDSDLLSIHDYTSYADRDRPENVIDKDESTLWHSSYQSGASLPVQITVDLNDVYRLEQINMLPSQRNRNGDIVQYRIEVSLDGEDYDPVVQGFFEHDGNALIDRHKYKSIKFDPVEARYVRLVALETLGNTMNMYASIAELTFYGLPKDPRLAETIEFAEETKEVVVGREIELDYTVAPEDYNEKLEWISSDESIVTVDNGIVTALKVGEAKVTLKGEKTSADITIRVVKGDITHLDSLVAEAEEVLRDKEVIKDIHEFLISELERELESAKEILEDESKQDDKAVKEAYDKLLKALNDLDKSVHFSILEDYLKFDLSIYDKDSTSEFEKVLADARELVKDIDSVESVLEINERFKEAAKKLVKLDFKQLQSTIDVAQDIDLSKLTNKSRERLELALENANRALDATTNKAIMKATEELEKALDSMKFAATDEQKSTLEAYKDILENLNLNNYKKSDQKEIKDWIKKLESSIRDKELDVETAKIEIDGVSKFLGELRTYIEKPFKGQPEIIRVGDTFTLYPDFDDQKGIDGWTYDKEYLKAIFDNGITFTALKEGTTRITYEDNKGHIQTTIIEILKKDDDLGIDPDPEKPGDEDSKPEPEKPSKDEDGKLPATGEKRSLLPLISIPLFVVAALIFLKRKRINS